MLSSLQAAELEGNPAEKGWPGEKINHLLATAVRVTQASLQAKQLLRRRGSRAPAAHRCQERQDWGRPGECRFV